MAQSREKELWDVYACLHTLLGHWIVEHRDVALARAVPHASCTASACAPVLLGAPRRNLFLCAASGRYHVCGKSFCDSAVGRASQWTCDVTRVTFAPDMCVYQSDLLQQCMGAPLPDAATPAFMQVAQFCARDALALARVEFARTHAPPPPPPASRHGWTLRADARALAFFDALFEFDATSAAPAAVHVPTAAAAAAAAAAEPDATALKLAASKRRKRQSGAEKKRVRRAVDAPPVHALDDVPDVEAARAASSTTAATAAAVAAATGAAATATPDAVTATGKVKNIANSINVPFHFDGLPYEESPAHVRVCLHVSEHEHAALIALAGECWIAWQHVRAVFAAHPKEADLTRGRELYTLDLHCAAMLLLSASPTTSLHWLRDGFVHHPELQRVLPNNQQLKQLRITKRRTTLAIQCLQAMQFYPLA
jgi:hypothetical protein